MTTRRTLPANPFTGSAIGSTSLAAAASASAHGVTPAAASTAASSSSSSSSSSPAPAPLPPPLPCLDVTLRWLRFCVHSSSQLDRLLHFWLHVMKMTLDRQIDAGDHTRTCCQFTGDKVGIRFEYDRFGPAPPRSYDPDSTLPPAAPVGAESLVIYVDSVSECVARCRESAVGAVYVEPMLISDQPQIRAAVLLDPLGIKIRIMEGEVYGLNKLRCRGRLGYVHLPLSSPSSLDRSLHFFGTVFRPSSTGPGGGGAARRASSILTVANGGSVHDAISSHSKQQQHGPGGSAGAMKNTGFRIVDMERFVDSLSTHAWLANGNRKKHTAVCLFHRLQREGVGTASGGGGDGDGGGDNGDAEKQERDSMRARMAAIDRKLKASEPEETKLFLGLSFTVSDLEQALGVLRQTEVGSAVVGGGGEGDEEDGDAEAAASSRLEVHLIPGFPRFLSFADPSGIGIEISDGAMAMGGIGGSGGGGGAYGAGQHQQQHGVGSATAAALLIRSNRMRAQAAQAAAANRVAPSQQQHHHRPSIAPLAGLRPFTPPSSSDSSRGTSPVRRSRGGGGGGGGSAMDDWSDDETETRKSGTSSQQQRRGQHSYPPAARGGGDSDGSVSDDDDDACALRSHVDSAMNYAADRGYAHR